MVVDVIRTVLAAVLALLLLAIPASAQSTMRIEPVTVLTANGPVTFQAEIAATEADRQAGMMFRKSMAPDAAMLFEFDEARPVSFWMKNTYLPLDIIFISADGTVAGVKENAVPLSESIIAMQDPVLAVLEVNAGTAKRIGLKQGDKVEHPFFKPAP